ncbi:hypothetical protein BDF22DRAFT_690144 [Syncephalis plumigaleata]|nr:hypothetical protein BDF22DRAFT_690144 [Syncephalis plumigaleata]
MSDTEETVSSIEDFPDAPPMISTGMPTSSTSNNAAVGVSDDADMSSVSFGVPTPARRASEPVAIFSQMERDAKLLMEAFGPEIIADQQGDIGIEEDVSLGRSNSIRTDGDDMGDTHSVDTADSRALFDNAAFEAEAGLPELIAAELFFEVPQVDPVSELLARHGTWEEQQQRNPALQVDPDDERTEEIIPVLVGNNAWRALAKYTHQQLLQCDSRDVDEILKLWYCRVLALCKLRLYQLAQTELDGLGELDRAELYYDSHPGLFPDQSGSMVPFELRVLHAQLPACLGDIQYSIDRIYALIVYCKRMANVMSESSKQEDRDMTEVWQAREAPLLLIVCRYLMQLSDFAAATSLMRHISSINAQDCRLLSIIGRLHLQMGNLLDAERMFDRVDAINQKAEDDQYQEMSQMNSAYMAAAIGDWALARSTFSQILEKNPQHETALNNLAVCQLYNRQLSEAKTTLQALIADEPRSSGCSPPVVFNLCALYELRSEASYERKRRLLCEVAQLAGDDMPAGCFKLGV